MEVPSCGYDIEHLVDSELTEHSILLKFCVQDSSQTEGMYFWDQDVHYFDPYDLRGFSPR